MTWRLPFFSQIIFKDIPSTLLQLFIHDTNDHSSVVSFNNFEELLFLNREELGKKEFLKKNINVVVNNININYFLRKCISYLFKQKKKY